MEESLTINRTTDGPRPQLVPTAMGLGKSIVLVDCEAAATGDRSRSGSQEPGRFIFDYLGTAGQFFGIWSLVLGIHLCLGSTLSASETSSFRTRILPILTKAGCNAGACHGAATGQGGFKLSLLGYDPEEDHDRITREIGARRINIEEPAESLFLRKPTRQVEHEGGRRIPRTSEAYQMLLRWIAAGAPYGAKDLTVTAISVTPPDSLLATTNQTLQLRVSAFLSDGSQEDATAQALYTSNDDAVAEVSKSGEITTRGRGLTSIMVRYAGQVAAARIAVPFGGVDPSEPGFPTNNFVDAHIGAELKRVGLPASELCGQGEFLRRVYLDTIGCLPSADEARAFLREPHSTVARKRIIDGLLQRDEFVDLWTMKFADLLLISGKRGSEASTRAYHNWLREQVARNAPFDQIARSLLTSAGQLTQVGPANFLTLANDPRDLAEQVGRIFLGTQIACARCHAHPADRWTQEDYHRFAAYFARISQDGGRISVRSHGEVDHPKTGQPLSPKPLGSVSPSQNHAEDRRVQLAAWLTAPDNPLFARAMVNRVWKHLLGRGLVEPVDDLRPTNPATHPALLDALAADFIAHRFDLRHLIRTILSSRTYQLSSRVRGLNRLDDRYYSHAYAKELPAPVFLDAIAHVTGLPDQFEGYPQGTRAVQLIGSRTLSYALDVLGRCARERSCDGVSRAGGGLAQALHLINGATINDKLDGGTVADLLARSGTDRE
ncbi:MAG: DUF1549 and DUF1553 domain-containing protein, partial [Verrucomicrobiales bacterium]|nr:DUF1549 and DUF1553 domain-containing protein [Verrucomicrobiales bacterium]